MPPPRGSFNPIEGPGDYTFTKTVHNDTYPAISPLAIPPLNKAVFIVGASRGIGRAIAKSYAQAGASHIAIGARSDLSATHAAVLQGATDAQRSPPQVLCVQVDVTSRTSTEAAAAAVERAFGRLDVLLLNFGVFSRGAVVDADPEEWWETFNVNVKGSYLVTRALLPLMLREEKQDGGGARRGDRIIAATASVGAVCVSPGTSAYQDSKLALVRFMEFVAKEHAEQGLIAFSIHPGNVPDTDILPGGIPDQLKHVFTETPEISGDALVYLTKERREWLSGRYINVTWDMPELMSKEDEIVKEDKLKVKLVI